MAELNLAAYLHGSLESAHKKLANDLNALDEDKAGNSPAPALRPAITTVAECGLVNALFATIVTTGAPVRPSEEERTAYYAGITTRAEALAALEAGTQRLYAAIDGVAPDAWGETVQGVFGPDTRFSVASFAAQHMMYHDGQLNSLHLMHGDTEMHWK